MSNEKALKVAEHIATIEAKAVVEQLAPMTTLEDKLRAAMRCTKTHWMLDEARAQDGIRVRAACAGVMMVIGVNSDDGIRIAEEHRALGQLGNILEALQKGVPVDLEAANEQKQVLKNPIGILDIWNSVQ